MSRVKYGAEVKIRAIGRFRHFAPRDFPVLVTVRRLGCILAFSRSILGNLKEPPKFSLRCPFLPNLRGVGNIWTDPLQLDSLRERVRMPDGKGKGSHHGREKKVYSDFQAAGSGGTPQ